MNNVGLATIGTRPVSPATKGEGLPGRQAKIPLIEGLRGLAASYVVLHHFGHILLRRQHPQLLPLFAFGQVAVMLFFILSGFVIFHSSFATNPVPTFGEYFLRRFRRIYPLFLLALATSYVAASLARGRLAPPDPVVLAGNLVLLQDQAKAGNWFAPYKENGPLWSLSYEWFFYMAFYPIASLLRERTKLQQYVVGVIGLIGFAIHAGWPNQVSLFAIYFILWWSGVEISREYSRSTAFRWSSLVPCVALISAFTLLWVCMIWRARRFGGTTPMLEFRQFATTLALLGIAFAWWRLGFRGMGIVTRLFLPVGAISYAMYVLHVPVMLVALAHPLTPYPVLDFVLWIAPVVVGLSYLAERRLQPALNRWLRAGSSMSRRGSSVEASRSGRV